LLLSFILLFGLFRLNWLVVKHRVESAGKLFDAVEKLSLQNLLMVGTDSHRQLSVVSLQDMMNLSLEFFTGGLEDQILVAVPTCQLFVLSHFLLLLLASSAHKMADLGTEVVKEADDSEKTVLIASRDDPLYGQKHKQGDSKR